MKRIAILILVLNGDGVRIRRKRPLAGDDDVVGRHGEAAAANVNIC